jgi:prefoldin subunit 5
VSERTPLAGLTREQADEAIQALEAKIDAQQESIKAAKEHLKALKAARKDLRDPSPADNGTVASAQTATVGVEAPEVGS